MNTRVAGIVAGFIAASGAVVALAQPTPPAPSFAPSNTTAKGVQSMASACAMCHGSQGRTVAGSAVASLAGRPRDEVVQSMAAFKSGLYHLAQRKPGLRMIPAHLNNLNRILPKGELLPVPFISRLTFGPALTLAADEPKSAFLVRARAALCRLREI